VVPEGRRAIHLEILVVLAAALIGSGLYVSRAAGQRSCEELLEAHPWLAIDTSNVVGPFVTNALLHQLDSITWSEFRRRTGEASGMYLVHDSVDYIVAPAIARRARTDSLQARQIATVLTQLMTDDNSAQAVVAADLYASWPLPPEPASALLADASQRMFGRTQAVFALRRSWSEPQFYTAALSALCSLAARASGVQSLLPSPKDGRMSVILNEDERDLLSMLTRALIKRRMGGAAETPPLVAVLPPGNPVTVDVLEALQGTK
jgi:hypothetical protein